MSSTRSKSKASQKSSTTSKVAEHKFCDTKVFLLDKKLTNDARDNVEIIHLRNPCTEKSSRYVYAKHLSQIFELLNFDEQPRSWFINEMTCSNGNLYITFPFDPLFFALYYLQKNCSDRAMPLDQALEDKEFTNSQMIGDIVSVDQLKMIADQKGDASLKAFKYNGEKALKWLSIKCRKLSEEMVNKHFHIGAKSAYFIKSEKFEDTKTESNSELLSYAFGIISEYIKSDLAEKLMSKLGLEKAKISGKRKSTNNVGELDAKRMKIEDTIENQLGASNVNGTKEKKISTKDKQLAKAASGTKSISSFFTKK